MSFQLSLTCLILSKCLLIRSTLIYRRQSNKARAVLTGYRKFPLKKKNKQNAPNKNIAQGRLGAMSVIQVVQYCSFLDDIK